MELQKTQSSQSNPEKENKAVDIALSVFKVYHKSLVFKTYGTITKIDT